MKFMIRRETNRYDPTMSMYNVYESDDYVKGTSNGYKAGFGTHEDARRFIENTTVEQVSELVEEIET